MFDVDVINNLTDVSRKQLTDWLDTTHNEWVREGNTNELLVMAVETLLQAFGVEGYEWT